MTGTDNIEILTVREWDINEISDLYREGNWWEEEWDATHLNDLIRGSFAFIVASDPKTGKAVGMGRVISDGVSDAYIQDLVVHQTFRGRGIGRQILNTLISECTSAGISWIGVIAEPETEEFYLPSGFQRMKEHTPMLYKKQE